MQQSRRHVEPYKRAASTAETNAGSGGRGPRAATSFPSNTARRQRILTDNYTICSQLATYFLVNLAAGYLELKLFSKLL
jgi:hypothetical protein